MKKRSASQSGYAKVQVRYFQNGKQKRYVMEYVDGLPVSQWIDNNMDPIYALQEGHYEIIGKICEKYGYGERGSPAPLSRGDEDEPPF